MIPEMKKNIHNALQHYGNVMSAKPALGKGNEISGH